MPPDRDATSKVLGGDALPRYVANAIQDDRVRTVHSSQLRLDVLVGDVTPPDLFTAPAKVKEAIASIAHTHLPLRRECLL